MKETNIMESKRPAYEVKIGRVRATIWPSEGKHGKRHSVVVTRSYQVDGDWKSSAYLDPSDLLLAAKALEEAEAWIRGLRSKNPLQTNDLPPEEGF